MVHTKTRNSGSHGTQAVFKTSSNQNFLRMFYTYVPAQFISKDPPQANKEGGYLVQDYKA